MKTNMSINNDENIEYDVNKIINLERDKHNRPIEDVKIKITKYYD